MSVQVDFDPEIFRTSYWVYFWFFLFDWN